MSKNDGKELTALEVATRAGIRLDGLYPTLRAGRIPARKLNGRWLISAEAFAEYMAKRRKGNSAKAVEGKI